MKWRILFSIVFYTAVALFFYYSNPPEIHDCRGQRPSKPVFNGYLLSYNEATCHDLPLADAEILKVGGRNSRFAENADEHQKGIDAHVGDIVRVLIWFHDSGSTRNRADTTARGVRVGSVFDTKPSLKHSIAAFISADNAESIQSSDYGGDAAVNTDTPTVLLNIPNTTKACLQVGDLLERGVPVGDRCGIFPEGLTRYSLALPDSAANGSVKIDNLKSGDKYTGYILIHFKVVAPEPNK